MEALNFSHNKLRYWIIFAAMQKTNNGEVSLRMGSTAYMFCVINCIALCDLIYHAEHICCAACPEWHLSIVYYFYIILWSNTSIQLSWENSVVLPLFCKTAFTRIQACEQLEKSCKPEQTNTLWYFASHDILLIYSQSWSGVPVVNGLMNSLMENWFCSFIE